MAGLPLYFPTFNPLAFVKRGEGGVWRRKTDSKTARQTDRQTRDRRGWPGFHSTFPPLTLLPLLKGDREGGGGVEKEERQQDRQTDRQTRDRRRYKVAGLPLYFPTVNPLAFVKRGGGGGAEEERQQDRQTDRQLDRQTDKG